MQWMHPEKMFFLTQNITCEVAYIWLVSNRLRLTMTQLDRTLKRKVSFYVHNSCLFAQLNSSARLSLLDLEGWLFGCCLSVLICSFHVFCLYRYECGLSCKLSLESFGTITNSGRIRNRRLYFAGLLRCTKKKYHI